MHARRSLQLGSARLGSHGERGSVRCDANPARLQQKLINEKEEDETRRAGMEDDASDGRRGDGPWMPVARHIARHTHNTRDSGRGDIHGDTTDFQERRRVSRFKAIFVSVSCLRRAHKQTITRDTSPNLIGEHECHYLARSLVTTCMSSHKAG